MQDATTLYVQSMDDVRMERGDYIMFSGDVVHAGSAYDHDNARIRFYVDGVDVPPVGNATYFPGDSDDDDDDEGIVTNVNEHGDEEADEDERQSHRPPPRVLGRTRRWRCRRRRCGGRNSVVAARPGSGFAVKLLAAAPPCRMRRAAWCRRRRPAS